MPVCGSAVQIQASFVRAPILPRTHRINFISLPYHGGKTGHSGPDAPSPIPDATTGIPAAMNRIREPAFRIRDAADGIPDTPFRVADKSG
uniref:Uncharacterized protein n=2 Tax=Candidatus Kentrum sp. DK TaxID=2126562 RepID=A0A450S3T8_9GAMM|nr:MAG: hypothetical protein BECKDK2373B_GA0170837_101316 [Candidatus Kentron sp. DK]